MKIYIEIYVYCLHLITSLPKKYLPIVGSYHVRRMKAEASGQKSPHDVSGIV